MKSGRLSWQTANLVGQGQVPDVLAAVVVGPEGSNVDEVIEAKARHDPVALIEAGRIGMQADRAIAELSQLGRQTGYRAPCQLVIGVEAVNAKRVLVESGQHRRFGAHRVGAPGRHAKMAPGQGLLGQGVELGQQIVAQAAVPGARVEEGLALHHDQVRESRGVRYRLGHGRIGRSRYLKRASCHQAVGPERAEQSQAAGIVEGIEPAGRQVT